jgi:hypothetical protein
MTGHRRTAVALHSLHAEDREWMLATLSEADRNVVRAGLQELIDLGFDGAEADEFACTESIPAPQVLTEVHSLSEAKQLQCATPEALFAVLANEPSTLIAYVLMLAKWDSIDQFTSFFAPQRQLKIHQAFQYGMQGGIKADAFLINAVVRRLQMASSQRSVTQYDEHPKVGVTSIFHRAYARIFNRKQSWIQ